MIKNFIIECLMKVFVVAMSVFQELDRELNYDKFE